MIRWCCVLLLTLLALGAPLVGPQVLAASPMATLHGVVTTVSGTPVPNAFLTIGKTVETDSQGAYTLDVPIEPSLTATLWAPGFNQEQISVELPSGVLAGDSVGFNFSGPFGLTSAFVNRAAHATLGGLTPIIPVSERSVHLYGQTGVPLESKLAVTLPDGRVGLYRLAIHGNTFSSELPVTQDGVYRVEVNSTSGIAVFNVPVFHGVSPAIPHDGVSAADPAGASPARLATFALSLLNQIRMQAGLSPLQMNGSLIRAAQAHDADMLRYGYVDQHPHIGSDGSTPLQRVLKVDHGVRKVGENVAEAGTVAQAVTSLLESPLHRAIILGHYRIIGIAVMRDSNGWLLTADLAS